MIDWEDRFWRFAASKEQEARSASLSPLRTVRDGGGTRLTEVGNAWSTALFDGPFYLSPAPAPDLPSTSLVFVESREGNTAARDPAALGGGCTDKHLIYEGLSRVAADAVLAGAETTRGGDIVFSVWHPEAVALRRALGQPRHPMQVVATLRGLALEEGVLFNIPELRVALITVGPFARAMEEGLRARPWILPIIMDSPRDLASAFRRLRAMGVERISSVGGRSIARSLIDAGLTQDLYLTTSPRSGGEPDTPLYPARLDGELVVEKEGTGPDEGVVFRHLVLHPR